MLTHVYNHQEMSVQTIFPFVSEQTDGPSDEPKPEEEGTEGTQRVHISLSHQNG